MDDSVPGIHFDGNGECTFCKIHDRMDKRYPMNSLTGEVLKQKVEVIKKSARNKKYDCIVGVSGGRDSTYTLLQTVRAGLNPLAVHFDNGWNSDTAVKNIKHSTNKLGVDLYTHVADWEEFKDLQLAFLKASVPDGEVPTDWAITSTLFKVASQEKIKWIIVGHSFRTEGSTPLSWTYQDGKYLKSIHSKFGKLQGIKSFPIMTMTQFLKYTFIENIKFFRLLYYVPYHQDEVTELLQKELDWNDYGGKHFESTYTSFYQSYILTRKFNIDKRKLHYSALIREGQLNREVALKKIHQDPFSGGIEMIEYNLKKLGLSNAEFEQIMDAPVKSFKHYSSYYNFILSLRVPMRIGTNIGIIPEAIYQKYFNFNY